MCIAMHFESLFGSFFKDPIQLTLIGKHRTSQQKYRIKDGFTKQCIHELVPYKKTIVFLIYAYA